MVLLVVVVVYLFVSVELCYVYVWLCVGVIWFVFVVFGVDVDVVVWKVGLVECKFVKLVVVEKCFGYVWMLFVMMIESCGGNVVNEGSLVEKV